MSTPFGRYEKYGSLVDGPSRFPTAAEDSEVPEEEWFSKCHRWDKALSNWHSGTAAVTGTVALRHCRNKRPV